MTTPTIEATTKPSESLPLTVYAPSTTDHPVLLTTLGIHLDPRANDASRAALAGDFDQMRQVATHLMGSGRYCLPGSGDMEPPAPGTLLVVRGYRETVVATFWVTQAKRVLSNRVLVSYEPAPEYTAIIGMRARDVLTEGINTPTAPAAAPSETEWANVTADCLIYIDGDPAARRALDDHLAVSGTHANSRTITIDDTTAATVQRMAEETGKEASEIVAASVRLLRYSD